MRARRTWLVTLPTSFGIVRERGSGVRSSMRSAAPSTPATSRAPHASVSVQGGESARGATSASTSASVTSAPFAQVEILSTSPASS